MPFLCGYKFPAVKFKTIAYVDAVGQQGDGNLGNYTGVIIFDECIVAANINYSTEHVLLL